ncbi:hypothetical protein [Sphingomonas sp. PAMC 26605]|uniref:hypothetical protein n=1 Tax=Sphingomonas sp. PAMC 26605 TaxID=1112214 RepID=UPI00026CD68D|nr:hypothetical protein [Sphingomonas sp. PAMC 26605]
MKTPPEAAPMSEDVMQVQDARRAALIERLGTVADLACANPLPTDLGDVVYDLLRQSAAQIASDRKRLAHTARFDAAESYTTAFYEIADLLGITARAASPAVVWRDELRPKLETLIEIKRSMAYRTSLIGRETALADAAEAALAAMCEGAVQGMVESPDNAGLADAVAKILPIGNDRLPGDRVVPIYVRMEELRALHALTALSRKHVGMPT